MKVGTLVNRHGENGIVTSYYGPKVVLVQFVNEEAGPVQCFTEFLAEGWS